LKKGKIDNGGVVQRLNHKHIRLGTVAKQKGDEEMCMQADWSSIQRSGKRSWTRKTAEEPCTKVAEN
jgi:hypothetical protein